ncbi:MAG TPA: hypothetical protein VK949_02340 [Methylotenera sp.]|nr:hypothetical protein [Methylotenera sp.]
MSAGKLVILGIVLFVSIAAGYLALFEYREDTSGNQGWHFRYSQQK